MQRGRLVLATRDCETEVQVGHDRRDFDGRLKAGATKLETGDATTRSVARLIATIAAMVLFPSAVQVVGRAVEWLVSQFYILLVHTYYISLSETYIKQASVLSMYSISKFRGCCQSVSSVECESSPQKKLIPALPATFQR